MCRQVVSCPQCGSAAPTGRLGGGCELRFPLLLLLEAGFEAAVKALVLACWRRGRAGVEG